MKKTRNASVTNKHERKYVRKRERRNLNSVSENVRNIVKKSGEKERDAQGNYTESDKGAYIKSQRKFPNRYPE